MQYQGEGTITPGPIKLFGRNGDIVSIKNLEQPFTIFTKGVISEMYDSENNQIMASTRDNNGSFHDKILGGVDTIFKLKGKEFLRISYNKEKKLRQVVFKDNRVDYSFKKVNPSLFFNSDVILSSEKFEIIAHSKENKISFKFHQDFMYECLCCAIYKWGKSNET